MAGTPPNIDVHWPAILLARPGQFQHHPSPSAVVSTMAPPSPVATVTPGVPIAPAVPGAPSVPTSISSVGFSKFTGTREQPHGTSSEEPGKITVEDRAKRTQLPTATTNMAQIAGAGTITTTLSSAGAYDDTSDELSTQTPDMIEEKRPAFSVSIETIVVSALIFIAILAWFEFVRSWFDNTFDGKAVHDLGLVYHRFWYAIFVSVLVVILIYVVYRFANG